MRAHIYRSVYIEYIAPSYADESLLVTSWRDAQGRLCLQLTRGDDVLTRCIVEEL